MITRRTLLSGMGSAAMLAQLPTRAWATSPGTTSPFWGRR